MPLDRARGAERWIAAVRLALVASGAILLPFVSDQPGYHPIVARSLLAISAIYSVVGIVTSAPRRSSARTLGRRAAWTPTPIEYVWSPRRA